MTSVVLNALNTRVVPELLNSTFISLIPKIKHPKKYLIIGPLVFVMSFIS